MFHVPPMANRDSLVIFVWGLPWRSFRIPTPVSWCSQKPPQVRRGMWEWKRSSRCISKTTGGTTDDAGSASIHATWASDIFCGDVLIPPTFWGGMRWWFWQVMGGDLQKKGHSYIQPLGISRKWTELWTYENAIGSQLDLRIAARYSIASMGLASSTFTRLILRKREGKYTSLMDLWLLLL